RDITLRLLASPDLAQLEALEQRQERPWSRRQLEEVLQESPVAVLGMELANELVAYTVVARLPFDAELQAMLVAPEWRRHGLGESLLQAVIDQAFSLSTSSNLPSRAVRRRSHSPRSCFSRSFSSRSSSASILSNSRASTALVTFCSS
ncbi:MAG: GNAT family N-acetyltransferase, partial [Halomonadaceae bacterium]|nr:GNAT family N-acetyltransferase [Halomonadaceae bacterium]